MRGKIVNICIAIMNIMLGGLIIFFTTYVPDKTLLTVQEQTVVNYILDAMYIVLAVIAIINLVQSYNHRTDTTFNTAYLIGVFCVSFIFIKMPMIAVFNILSGVIVLYKSLKEKLVELNSTTGLSIAIVAISAILILAGFTYEYSTIGEKIKNKENENELAYSTDFFKYITELNEITDVFINVEKGGKYGYINSNGDVLIDFQYDYASPFVKISTQYDKEFYIALVCQDGKSCIILKNGRIVMSYRSESSDENVGAKIEELKDLYYNTFDQPKNSTFEFEVENITDNINKKDVYQEISDEYTYRYDYNDEYDLIVSQSNLGNGEKYELASKENLDLRITIDAENLDYDSKYLYLFADGTIPFYETTKNIQGWITSYSARKELKGKVQILEKNGDLFLLRDYNKNLDYFVNINGEQLSDSYKDIYICRSGKYIVRGQDDFIKVLNSDYTKAFEKEFYAINTRLIANNLYLTLDSADDLQFNDYGYVENLNWSLLNENGDIIMDGIENIYDLNLSNIDSNGKEIDDDAFKENLKDLVYNFVGDRFYNN